MLAPAEDIAVPASLSVCFNLNLADPPPGFPVAYVAGPGHLYRYGSGGREVTAEWIGVRLTPLGAYRLLGASLVDVGQRVTPFDDVYGAPGRELVERCRAASDAGQRFALLDEFLLRRAAAGPRLSAEVGHAWDRLNATGGLVRVARLAAELGWSSDHLGRVFRRQIGLPPKAAGRLVRLGRLLQCVGAHPARWSDLAAGHGFSDQAHLSREIREFTGSTPTAYFGGLRPCGCLTQVPAVRRRTGSDSFKTGA